MPVQVQAFKCDHCESLHADEAGAKSHCIRDCVDCGESLGKTAAELRAANIPTYDARCAKCARKLVLKRTDRELRAAIERLDAANARVAEMKATKDAAQLAYDLARASRKPVVVDTAAACEPKS